MKNFVIPLVIVAGAGAWWFHDDCEPSSPQIGATPYREVNATVSKAWLKQMVEAIPVDMGECPSKEGYSEVGLYMTQLWELVERGRPEDFDIEISEACPLVSALAEGYPSVRDLVEGNPGNKIGFRAVTLAVDWVSPTLGSY